MTTQTLCRFMKQKNQLRKLRHRLEQLQKAEWEQERREAVEAADRQYRAQVEAWHASFGERVEWEGEA